MNRNDLSPDDQLVWDETHGAGNGDATSAGVRNPRNRNPDGYAVTGVTAPHNDGIRNGAHLMAATFPELNWHVPNVIPEGFTLLVGAPKIGKSWLSHGIALAACSGGKALGERLTARPVLHLALEDSERRLQSRSKSLGYGVTDGVTLIDWHYLIRLPAGRSARQIIADWLERLPDDVSAPLVIVDTYGRVKGARMRDESPYDHDYRIGAAMKELADSVDGMAFVAVHHDRKAGSADFVDDVSGTHGIAGSADTIVVLRRDRTQADGVLLVTGRDVTEAAYGVSLSERGVWSLIGGSWESAREAAASVAATAGRGDLAARIVAWLASNAAGSPTEIAKALGAEANTVKQSLYRMHSAELVDRDKGSYFLPAPIGGTP